MDPLGTWVKLRDTMIESWSKAMTDVVGSDAYAQATGAMLNNYLTVATPAQQAIERAMGPILAQLNMPSRTEVLSLSERLTNVELRLDDLDAKIDEIRRFLASLAQGAGPSEG
jgi:hypothetical protein